MKIVKRSEYQSLGKTAQIWVIPTLSYIVQKIAGVKMHDEWLWLVILPICFIAWIILNFKIKRQKPKCKVCNDTKHIVVSDFGNTWKEVEECSHCIKNK